MSFLRIGEERRDDPGPDGQYYTYHGTDWRGMCGAIYQGVKPGVRVCTGDEQRGAYASNAFSTALGYSGFNYWR